MSADDFFIGRLWVVGKSVWIKLVEVTGNPISMLHHNVATQCESYRWPIQGRSASV